MMRRTNTPSDGPRQESSRPFLSRPVRRERADDRPEPAIDWLAADPVFQGRVTARA